MIDRILYWSAASLFWSRVELLDGVGDDIKSKTFGLSVHDGISSDHLGALGDSQVVKPFHWEEEAPADDEDENGDESEAQELGTEQVEIGGVCYHDGPSI